MNNMNNKINENKKMKFNTFYYVNRTLKVDNTNGINIITEDKVRKIFLTPDECYNYLIKERIELKDVLYDYINKTDFISKINYLKDKLSEINNYFPDNIIFKYDFYKNDYPETTGREFGLRLVTETNKKGSFQIDANTKAVIDETTMFNNSNLHGIYIVPLKFDPDKINK